MRRSLLLPFLLGAGLLGGAAAHADSIYMKLPNAVGDSTAAGFAGDVELLAYSQSCQVPYSLNTGTPSTGKPQCGAISIQKHIDSASTSLFADLLMGTTLPIVKIYFTGALPKVSGASPYAIVLTNVRVTAISQNDASGLGAGTLTESVQLAATKFQITYHKVNADGTLGGPETTGWDLATNTSN